MKKKIISLLSAAAMLIPSLKTMNAGAISFTLNTQIKSESAILLNLDCDEVIYEKNADAKQMPGPLVNIMTAVVCIENCADLNEEITIDEEVFSPLYVTDYPDDLRFAEIEDGDILTYTDLLYAMMLKSSIEASQTIAYQIGGESVSAFVEMMNDKAEELGLKDTHFTNPTGLYDPEQYTSARDMAVLTKYALKTAHFDTISSTYEYTPSVPNLDRHPDRQSWVWYHSNLMMDKDNDYYYPGTRGIKTANLEMGGRNIAATASKDGNNYLLICLKSPLNNADGDNTFYHLTDAITLFNWAFKHFSYQIVLPDTAELGEIPVELAEGNNYVLAKPKEEMSMLWYNDVDTSLISRDNIKWYKTSLKAPIKKGEPLGMVTLEYAGEPIGSMELVAVSDVDRSFAKYNLYAAKMFPKASWFKKALIISGVICLIYILVCIYAYAVFKNKKKPIKPIYAVPKVEGQKKRRKPTNKE
ncbi:MAG: D-alanyl-D-alanine carboxypeptidase [Ruminococcus sp.]|nr:D-alanyl-D-alanine carboxypeptidase [Ruminococcus sp.]